MEAGKTYPCRSVCPHHSGSFTVSDSYIGSLFCLNLSSIPYRFFNFTSTSLSLSAPYALSSISLRAMFALSLASAVLATITSVVGVPLSSRDLAPFCAFNTSGTSFNLTAMFTGDQSDSPDALLQLTSGGAISGSEIWLLSVRVAVSSTSMACANVGLPYQPNSTFSGPSIVFEMDDGRLLPLQDGTVVATDASVSEGDPVSFFTGSDPSDGSQAYCGVVRRSFIDDVGALEI